MIYGKGEDMHEKNNGCTKNDSKLCQWSTAGCSAKNESRDEI